MYRPDGPPFLGHNPIVDMHGSKTIVLVVDDDLLFGDLVRAARLDISQVEAHGTHTGHVVLLPLEPQTLGDCLKPFPIDGFFIVVPVIEDRVFQGIRPLQEMRQVLIFLLKGLGEECGVLRPGPAFEKPLQSGS